MAIVDGCTGWLNSVGGVYVCRVQPKSICVDRCGCDTSETSTDRDGDKDVGGKKEEEEMGNRKAGLGLDKSGRMV